MILMPVLLEPFDVAQVLGAPGCAVVADELLEPDDVHRDLAERARDPAGPCVIEGDTGQLRQDVDPSGWDANLIHDAGSREAGFGDRVDWRTDGGQRTHDACGVRRVDPDVKV